VGGSLRDKPLKELVDEVTESNDRHRMKFDILAEITNRFTRDTTIADELVRLILDRINPQISEQTMRAVITLGHILIESMQKSLEYAMVLVGEYNKKDVLNRIETAKNQIGTDEILNIKDIKEINKRVGPITSNLRSIPAKYEIIKTEMSKANYKTTVETCVRNHGHWAFEYAEERFKRDKEFVLELVDIDPGILQYADDSLKTDLRFMCSAVEVNAGALDYAIASLPKFRKSVSERLGRKVRDIKRIVKGTLHEWNYKPSSDRALSLRLTVGSERNYALFLFKFKEYTPPSRYATATPDTEPCMKLLTWKKEDPKTVKAYEIPGNDINFGDWGNTVVRSQEQKIEIKNVSGEVVFSFDKKFNKSLGKGKNTLRFGNDTFIHIDEESSKYMIDDIEAYTEQPPTGLVLDDVVIGGRYEFWYKQDKVKNKVLYVVGVLENITRGITRGDDEIMYYNLKDAELHYQAGTEESECNTPSGTRFFTCAPNPSSTMEEMQERRKKNIQQFIDEHKYTKVDELSIPHTEIYATFELSIPHTEIMTTFPSPGTAPVSGTEPVSGPAPAAGTKE